MNHAAKLATTSAAQAIALLETPRQRGQVNGD
jgi:hypothetical protein